MAAKGSYAITKLGESNYKMWKTDMVDVLLGEELWRIVSGKDKGPSGGTESKQEAWEIRAAKAAGMIRLAMEDRIRARYTADEYLEDPVALWNKIAEDHKAVVVLDKNYLITQLHAIKLEDHGSVAAYIDAIGSITENLATCGKKLDDDNHWFYITNGLPASWAVFREIIEGPGSGKRDVPALITRMLAKEAQLKREKGIGADTALYAKKDSCGDRSGKKGDRGGDHDSRGGLECFYCGKRGHKRFECHKYKADKASGKVKDSGGGDKGAGSQSTAAKVTEDIMWVAQEIPAIADVALRVGADPVWIVDSGCSRHLASDRALFIPDSYVEYKPGEHRIWVADDGVRAAAGYGDVIISVRDPSGDSMRAVTVRSVLHVPGCGGNNLLSMGQLEGLGFGFEVGMKKGVYRIVRDGLVVAEMDKVGGVYVLRTGGAAPGAAMGAKEDKEERHGETGNAARWHFRLGHLGLRAVDKLGRAGCGVPAITCAAGNCICEACLSGKMARKPFTAVVESSRAVGLLDLVHSDIMGPMETPSMSGVRYVLLFVDDRSRFKHCYILKQKSEAFERFKEYRARVEKQTGRQIGRLQTDGGGKYTSSQFLDYLRREGIAKETTTPHTPQSNGVSERANRTIMEAAKP